MVKKQAIAVKVNGQMFERLVAPRLLLCDFLRDDLELTGTHVGCTHGYCGSCTVWVDRDPVRSCLLLAIQLDGREIHTVESLGSDEHLHPIQKAFHECHALQCGFCTPGILMSCAALLRECPQPSDAQILETLSGHLCRCTGYQHIIQAVKQAAGGSIE